MGSEMVAAALSVVVVDWVCIHDVGVSGIRYLLKIFMACCIVHAGSFGLAVGRMLVYRWTDRTKCLITDTSCEYPPLERWINETGDGSVSSWSRPTFVGRREWNVVCQLLSDPRTVDPFDSMPLSMSSKFHELFRYFLIMRSSKDGTTAKGRQIIRNVADNPNSFHGNLLLAGLHYYWNNGNLGGFSSTYYAHKVNLIRSINAYLGEVNYNDLG
ncbi:hypothetical protein LZ32DRAFT_623299 [Colletotrichum eremochloae]|nr:hypothetical protein LZ32DRAFT_623299 [Colletotrichum eremochloae]